jgi:hypothetical protein
MWHSLCTREATDEQGSLLSAERHEDLDKNEKKNLKIDPISYAEKWAKAQTDLLKKMAELEAADKSMQEQIVGMSASLKKLIELVEKKSPQEAKLLHQLFPEYDRAFKDDVKGRSDKLNVAST